MLPPAATRGCCGQGAEPRTESELFTAREKEQNDKAMITSVCEHFRDVRGFGPCAWPLVVFGKYVTPFLQDGRARMAPSECPLRVVQRLCVTGAGC